MSPDQQDRVVVVLVRARNPQNIGAAARALHDLGYTHLRIVNDFPVPFAAARSAVDASAILASATETPTLAAAIADCTFVLGTTAVGDRALEHPLHLLPAAAELIRDHLETPSAKVALLFGSEKTGLSNEELSHCHALLTIPMNTRNTTRHLSMNLGQAVAVCLYALSQTPAETQTTPAPPEPLEPPAPAANLERLTTLLREVLDLSGYTRRHPANTRDPTLRRLIRRMAFTAADTPVWTGILRHILFRLTPPASPAPAHPSNSDPRPDQDRNL